MECEIKWNAGDGISFAAKTGSGHLIVLDTAKDVTEATSRSPSYGSVSCRGGCLYSV